MYNTHSFEFSFYPPFSFFVLYKTYWLLFCILSFCFSCCPSSPLPFSLLLLLLASACARSISFFCFMLTLSFSLFLFLPHNTPNHPRDQACLLCLFHISALCSCDGNLSFKYLFLPSPDFPPSFSLFVLPLMHTSFHPWNLNCALSILALGDFKALRRSREAGQDVILLLRNSISLHAVCLCFGSLSAANQLAMPVTTTELYIAKEL